MATILLMIIYLAFINFGLPDSMLGVSWPTMYPEFGVELSTVGILSWIGTAVGITTSLNANRIIRRFGAPKVVLFGAIMTSIALFCYSNATEFWMLCLLCIPMGLSGGCVDIALNNYVALHYASRHMSWIHCMWGVGTIIGTNVIAFGFSKGMTWQFGYRCVFYVEVFLAVCMLLSQPIWKKDPAEKGQITNAALPLKDVVKIRGAKEIIVTFFCYNALEQTMMLWAGSYMVLYNGVSAESAARFASLFFLGITAGRMLSGFMTLKFSDNQLIRLGQMLIGAGIVIMLLPFGNAVTLAGMLIIGLGCAPITPCLLHSTPVYFGPTYSQALVGVQIAACSLGNCIMPSLFGLVANYISVALLPLWLTLCLVVMIYGHTTLMKKTHTKLQK